MSPQGAGCVAIWARYFTSSDDATIGYESNERAHANAFAESSESQRFGFQITTGPARKLLFKINAMKVLTVGKKANIDALGHHERSGAEGATKKSLSTKKRDDGSKNVPEEMLTRADRNRKLGAILFFSVLALFIALLLLLSFFWEDFGLA